LPEEEWVARCLGEPFQKEAPNASNVTCNTLFFYKDIHIQMTLSGMYINSMAAFKQKVKQLFSSWELPKEGKKKS